MSKITGHGCDVVDGLAAPRIALEFPSRAQPISAFAGTMDTRVASPAEVGGQQPAITAQSSSRAIETQAGAELFILKPALWGMSIDLKEAYRRVRRMVWRPKIS